MSAARRCSNRLLCFPLLPLFQNWTALLNMNILSLEIMAVALDLNCVYVNRFTTMRELNCIFSHLSILLLQEVFFRFHQLCQKKRFSREFQVRTKACSVFLVFKSMIKSDGRFPIGTWNFVFESELLRKVPE